MQRADPDLRHDDPDLGRRASPGATEDTDRRTDPLRGLALVEGPPDPKDRLSIMLPKMKVINCRCGVNELEVRKFLEALENGAV